MKEKLCILLATGLLSTAQLKAQTSWTYDFGIVPSATFATSLGSSTTFLPPAQTNGGTPLVRIANSSTNPIIGSANLNHPGTAGLGSGTDFSLVAPGGDLQPNLVYMNMLVAKMVPSNLRCNSMEAP